MKELDILVFSVMIDQSTTNVISNDTKLQHMKELFINVTHVITKQHKKGI